MRLFQNASIYPAYVPRLRALTDGGAMGFAEQVKVFLDDRYAASHVLEPVLEGSDLTFFTVGNDRVLQLAWARENGFGNKVGLEEVLLAQIEAHRTEVFYNLDPVRFSGGFVRKLPGCVKKALCWRAAPGQLDLTAYDLVVCNFPSIIENWRAAGCRAEYFFPAHDPVMDAYAKSTERPIDVLFVGGYSRHHLRRAEVLEAVAKIATDLNVAYCLDRSRATRLAESAVGKCLPMSRYRRPAAIRRVSRDPVFGRDLYRLLAQSKVVLNGAVDMAREDRGNMRCFEAMGLGCLLLSDAGRYPIGMNAETMLMYDGAGDARAKALEALSDWERYSRVAAMGYEAVRHQYAKSTQWRSFVSLVQ